MALLGWFRGRSRAVLHLGDVSLELEGDAVFVERTLARVLAEHRAHPEVPVESVAAPPARLEGREPSVRRRKGEYVRVHAIDGDIAKVYSVEARLFKRRRLTRALDLSGLVNVYAEDPLLVRHLKGDQLTLWHRLLPAAPEITARSGETLIVPRHTVN